MSTAAVPPNGFSSGIMSRASSSVTPSTCRLPAADAITAALMKKIMNVLTRASRRWTAIFSASHPSSRIRIDRNRNRTGATVVPTMLAATRYPTSAGWLPSPRGMRGTKPERISPAAGLTMTAFTRKQAPITPASVASSRSTDLTVPLNNTTGISSDSAVAQTTAEIPFADHVSDH